MDIRAGGIYSESKTHHMRASVGPKRSQTLQKIKEIYPSIKWKFRV